jgi:hypothetical protein
MSECNKCGGVIPVQGLGAGTTEFCTCRRPMSFADIQELFDLSMSDECEDAARLLDLVRRIERFHGIGR